MAVITSINIKNFKGINDVTIKLNQNGASPVHTLIGLNESGKTTILEALSHFVTGDNAVSSLFDGVHSKTAVTALIPVNRKAAFSGSITISATVILKEDDYLIAATLGEKQGLEIDKESFLGEITIERAYKFLDSEYTASSNYWNFDLKVRKIPNGRSKPKSFLRYKRPEEGPDLWAKIVATLQMRLPRIAYFPTFLVDIPKKIYLAPYKGESASNRYYRTVFQDILNALDEGLTLEKHVISRIEKLRSAEENPNWLSALLGGSDRQPIDSVFAKISSAVTREVLGSWQEIFNRKISARSISVDWAIDSERDDIPYATFSISDGESRYFISERSLGFRWFFSFLLFTAFKHQDRSSTLFLFDEPAANLHAKAQAELLKSFSRTVKDGDGIIYSTHSHHMINPRWVSGAYIVENTALDYDSQDDTFGLNTKPTNITATPYRIFVAQHPTRTSYFQPVVDMLEYVVPTIIGDPPFVIVEGITDFYALSIALKFSKNISRLAFIPGVGSGASGPQISLLMGRGDDFTVMLDDDKAGRISADKYRTEWYLTNQIVFTVGELLPDFRGKRLEGFLSEALIEDIRIQQSLTSRPSKKQIGLFLAEKFSSGADKNPFDDETQSKFEKLLHVLQGKFTA